VVADPARGDTALGLPADFLIEPDGRIRAVSTAGTPATTGPSTSCSTWRAAPRACLLTEMPKEPADAAVYIWSKGAWVPDIAQKLGVSQRTVCRWTAQAR
jgi:hypothetical protein